jgi:hypothetical protein
MKTSMVERFRQKTRLCPLLETAYTAFPREVPSECPCDSRVLYRYPKTRSITRQGIPIYVTFTIVGTVEEYTFKNQYMYNDTIVDPWEPFKNNVFNLYGNTPVRPGILNGVTNITTKIYYPYGSPLPPTGGRFRPTVTFI